MNNRFKFRIFLKAHNQMCNVHTLHTGTNKVIISTRYGNSSVQINDYNILMQCTGLKDKNDKLIYECDIVKDEHNALHYVKWVYDSWQLFPCTQNNYTKCIVDDDIEVIGNIYENKELLESEG